MNLRGNQTTQSTPETPETAPTGGTADTQNGAKGPANGSQRILYQAYTQGFSAVCDAFATETEGSPAGLWLLSIIGPQNGCKAIIANILKDRPETLKLEPDLESDDDASYDSEEETAGRWDNLEAYVPTNYVTNEPVPFTSTRDQRSGKWTYKATKLPLTRAWHVLAYSVRAQYDRDDSNFILVGKPQETRAPERHLQFLNRRISLPLHPAWADWLWDRGLETGEIAKLHSLGIQAWKCEPNEMALRWEITQAIVEGEINTPRPNG